MAGIPILYVLVRTANVPHVYGGEKSTLATAEALPREGFEPRFLVSARDDLAKELSRRGLLYSAMDDVFDPFEGLRAAGWVGRAKGLFQIIRMNAAVLQVIRAHEVKIVHANAVPGFFVAWLGARLGRAKVVYHVRGASRNRRTRWFERVAVMLADRTLTVSSSLREQLLDSGPAWLGRALARQVEPVATGFDFDRIDEVRSEPRALVRSQLGPSPDRVSAVIVGGIYQDKGQLPFLERVLPQLIEALPSLHVTLVGGIKDERYAARCHEAISRAGIDDHVTFTGYVDSTEVYRYYHAADLLLLPSEREGLPRVAIEAQAFGLPVVATRIVGCVDAIRDGETGILVDPEQLEEMIPAVQRLARDEALREQMGLAGAAWVRRRYSLDRNVKEIARIYRTLLAS